MNDVRSKGCGILEDINLAISKLCDEQHEQT